MADVDRSSSEETDEERDPHSHPQRIRRTGELRSSSTTTSRQRNLSAVAVESVRRRSDESHPVAATGRSEPERGTSDSRSVESTSGCPGYVTRSRSSAGMNPSAVSSRPSVVGGAGSKSRSTAARFRVGDEVLVRWGKDGRVYFATVKSVRGPQGDKELSYAVAFEDKTRYTAPESDVFPVDAPASVCDLCTVCESSKGDAKNKLVACNGCDALYHQLCHSPPIIDQYLKEPGRWQCRKCFVGREGQEIRVTGPGDTDPRDQQHRQDPSPRFPSNAHTAAIGEQMHYEMPDSCYKSELPTADRQMCASPSPGHGMQAPLAYASMGRDTGRGMTARTAPRSVHAPPIMRGRESAYASSVPQHQPPLREHQRQTSGEQPRRAYQRETSSNQPRREHRREMSASNQPERKYQTGISGDQPGREYQKDIGVPRHEYQEEIDQRRREHQRAASVGHQSQHPHQREEASVGRQSRHALQREEASAGGGSLPPPMYSPYGERYDVNKRREPVPSRQPAYARNRHAAAAFNQQQGMYRTSSMSSTGSAGSSTGVNTTVHYAGAARHDPKLQTPGQGGRTHGGAWHPPRHRQPTSPVLLPISQPFGRAAAPGQVAMTSTPSAAGNGDSDDDLIIFDPAVASETLYKQCFAKGPGARTHSRASGERHSAQHGSSDESTPPNSDSETPSARRSRLPQAWNSGAAGQSPAAASQSSLRHHGSSGGGVAGVRGSAFQPSAAVVEDGSRSSAAPSPAPPRLSPVRGLETAAANKSSDHTARPSPLQPSASTEETHRSAFKPVSKRYVGRERLHPTHGVRPWNDDASHRASSVRAETETDGHISQSSADQRGEGWQRKSPDDGTTQANRRSRSPVDPTYVASGQASSLLTASTRSSTSRSESKVSPGDSVDSLVPRRAQDDDQFVIPGMDASTADSPAPGGVLRHRVVPLTCIYSQDEEERDEGSSANETSQSGADKTKARLTKKGRMERLEELESETATRDFLRDKFRESRQQFSRYSSDSPTGIGGFPHPPGRQSSTSVQGTYAGANTPQVAQYMSAAPMLTSTQRPEPMMPPPLSLPPQPYGDPTLRQQTARRQDVLERDAGFPSPSDSGILSAGAPLMSAPPHQTGGHISEQHEHRRLPREQQSPSPSYLQDDDPAYPAYFPEPEDHHGRKETVSPDLLSSEPSRSEQSSAARGHRKQYSRGLGARAKRFKTHLSAGPAAAKNVPLHAASPLSARSPGNAGLLKGLNFPTAKPYGDEEIALLVQQLNRTRRVTAADLVNSARGRVGPTSQPSSSPATVAARLLANRQHQATAAAAGK
eukprot:scpid9614/ scgid5711/ Metal-response element-binding transcription factor 2; Metal regulatory transcription factor 2